MKRDPQNTMSYNLHLEMAEGVEGYYKCKGCKGYFEHQPSRKKMALILFRKNCKKDKKMFQVREKKVFISWMGDFHEWHLNAWLISCRFTFVSTISLDIHLFYFQVPNFPSSSSIIFSSFYTIYDQHEKQSRVHFRAKFLPSKDLSHTLCCIFSSLKCCVMDRFRSQYILNCKNIKNFPN